MESFEVQLRPHFKIIERHNILRNIFPKRTMNNVPTSRRLIMGISITGDIGI